MMQYAFYVTTYQIGGESQVHTQTDVDTDRYRNLIGYTGRPTGIKTKNIIVLGFSCIIIQS